MKELRRVSFFLGMMGLFLASHAQAEIHLIPKPVQLVPQEGQFVLENTTKIRVAADKDKTLGQQLSDYLETATGWKLPVEVGEPADNSIYLTSSATAEEVVTLGVEGYRMTVSPKRVMIESSAPNGVFYGIQTLRQLLPAAIYRHTKVASANWTIPCVTIDDTPRFSWRSIMHDCSRHFYNICSLKRLIDQMVVYKFNRLHLHLIDDHGWRIEIKKYPRLANVGGFRRQTPIGRHGGYYTQDEIRDLVKYAQDRFITIIPEVEIPGHNSAVIQAYPHLACGDQGKHTTVGGFTDYPMLRKGFPAGTGSNVLCPGKETTFKFYQDVLDEVMDLFPSKYIHVGGDEVNKKYWAECADCKKRMADESIEDLHLLQIYMMNRIGNYLNENGRIMVGWDEILNENLDKKSVVMGWRGTRGGIAAAKAGYKVVMTPNTAFYLQMPQSTHPSHPFHWGPVKTPETVYSYDPVDKSLTTEQAKNILGCGGCVWSPPYHNEARLDCVLWPRACALAEVAWTAKNEKNLKDFLKRLEANQARLEEMHVSYWKVPKSYQVTTLDTQKDFGNKTWKITLPLTPGREYLCEAKQKGKGKLSLKNIYLKNGTFKIIGCQQRSGRDNKPINLWSFLLPTNAPQKGWTLVATVGRSPRPLKCTVEMYDKFEWKKPFRIIDCDATKPVPANADASSDWMKTHQAICKNIAATKPNVVVLGTDLAKLAEAKSSLFKGLKVGNITCSTEGTQNALWRIQHGALDGVDPKLVILQLGANNLKAGQSPQQITAGMAALVKEVFQRCPNTKILILGLLPLQAKTVCPYESVNNFLAATLHDRKRTFFYNANYSFLDKDGLINPDLFANDIALNRKGLDILEKELSPVVKRLTE